MVNSRRRAATTLGCCLAVTISAASPENVRRHDNGRTTTHHGVDVASLSENILASSSPRKRRKTRRRRRDSTRRLGGIHEKGHSFQEEQDVVMSTSSNNEEQDSSSPLPFLMLGTSTQTSTAVLTPPEEEPATSLTPYTATQIKRIGGPASIATQDPTRYPYMASLQIEGASPNAGKFDYHMCTGFLIAPDLVLTAAHCAEYTPTGSDETYQAFNGIEVGRINLSKEVPYDAFESSTYHLNYENLVPEKLVTHPKYDALTFEHDVMLVKVFGKSRFPPVRIDSSGIPDDQPLTVLGWGADSSSKKYSDDLREADLLVMTNEQCRATSVRVTDPSTGVSSDATLANNIYDDMVCASARDRYVCHGDGGGPALIRGDSSSQDVAAAIVSWGYGCVDPSYPAVMIRTADHFQWIRTLVCRESADPPEEYRCPGRGGGGGMALNSAEAAAARQTVTLKLKLDMMAVETGFVIVSTPENHVIAQRVPGYYKIRENQIVLERMDLPSNQCYKLILLDSFGDGFCCDMGGGSGTLYLGTDTGYYTGRALVEVSGKFQYDASGEFCLDSSAATTTTTSEGGSTAVMPPGGSGVGHAGGGSGESSGASNHGSTGTGNGSTNGGSGLSHGSTDGSTTNSNNGSTHGSTTASNNASTNSNADSSNSSNVSTDTSNKGSDNNQGEGTSGWTGPAMSPEFEYCNQFCNANPNALNCGSYTCFHSEDSTSDSQESHSSVSGGGSSGVSSSASSGSGGGTSEQEADGAPSDVPFDPEGNAADPAEYHLTVQFQFDDNPQDVSWVLYDLTENQVKMFVDFGVYTQEDFADQMLEVVANVDGPEAGEKKYAFTVYDKESDGLCCEHGEGYYKLFLGDVDDNLELLGDSEYEFSSSYYFTLFEAGNMTANGAEVEGMQEEEASTDAPIETSVPTTSPISDPTASPSLTPTPPPSNMPTDSPSLSPTHPPTTPPPTFPWEIKRSELLDEIGARWNTASVTPPDGKFTDLGGDQRNFDFTVGSQSKSGGEGLRILWFGWSALVLASVCALL